MNKKKSFAINQEQKQLQPDIKKYAECIALNKEITEKIEKMEAERINQESQITYNQNCYEKKLGEKNKKIEQAEKNLEQFKKQIGQRIKVITEEMCRKVDEAIKHNTKDITIFQSEISELKLQKEKSKNKKHQLKEKYEDLLIKYQKSQNKYEQKIIDDSNKYNNINAIEKPSTNLFNQFLNELTQSIKFSNDQLEQITCLQLSYAEKFNSCDQLISISSKSKDIIKQKNESIANLTDLVEGYKDTVNKMEEEMQRIDEDIKDLIKENKRMKIASKKILQQRTDTEIFFIEALDDVKKELYHRKKESEKRGNFFPTLKKFYDEENQNVDIRNLDPELKEKIIRKLFEKMNQGYEPSYYKEIHDVISIDIN